MIFLGQFSQYHGIDEGNWTYVWHFDLWLEGIWCLENVNQIHPEFPTVNQRQVVKELFECFRLGWTVGNIDYGK